MEQGEDASRPVQTAPANDNTSASDAARVDAALTRIAEALGRHIARQHIRRACVANDNSKSEHLPPEDS